MFVPCHYRQALLLTNHSCGLRFATPHSLIVSVGKYSEMLKPKVYIKSAWVITWEWMSDSAALADKIAGILNYRTSRKRVIDYVEHLYALHTANMEELGAYAKNRKNNIWRVSVDFNGRITCGRHPSLQAEYVKNIEISTDAVSGLETITWETFPKHKPTEDGFKLVMGPTKQGVKRRITGPLSFESIWDRGKNRLKDKFIDILKLK